MEGLFTSIYARGHWGPGSGTGSTGHALRQYTAVLQQLLRHLRPCSVLDVGCGFFDPYSHMDWSGIHYVGLDVVIPVITHNRARFATPSRRFVHADIIDRAARPTTAFDLVLVKDVMQHLSYARVVPLLRYLSAFPRVLITNSTNQISENSDAVDGGYRPLDVRLPPLCVPGCELITYTVAREPELDVKTVLYWQPPLEPWVPPVVSLNVLSLPVEPGSA
jgi:SAM-dependent methyltransferase